MKSTHLKLLPAWMPLTLLLACDPPSTTGTPAKDASQSALQVPILSVQEQVKWVDDSRQIISVTDDERAVIKYTMQENLRAIAQLLEAAARGDRTRVVKIAEAASVAPGPGKLEPALRERFSDEWRAMGQVVHLGFADIAQKTAEGDDTTPVQAGVAKLLSTCNACHDSYRLVPVSGTP